MQIHFHGRRPTLSVLNRRHRRVWINGIAGAHIASIFDAKYAQIENHNSEHENGRRRTWNKHSVEVLRKFFPSLSSGTCQIYAGDRIPAHNRRWLQSGTWDSLWPCLWYASEILELAAVSIELLPRKLHWLECVCIFRSTFWPTWTVYCILYILSLSYQNNTIHIVLGRFSSSSFPHNNEWQMFFKLLSGLFVHFSKRMMTDCDIFAGWNNYKCRRGHYLCTIATTIKININSQQHLFVHNHLAR